MTTTGIEAVRKDLRERLATPGKFDAPPSFIKGIPEGQITEADVGLWHSAESAWHAHQDAEDRRFVERMDRRKQWIATVIVVAAIAYVVVKLFGH